MYKGVQKRFWAIVATLLLCCMLIACGDSADSSTTNKTETDCEVSETVGSQSIPDGTSEEITDAADCPEGYVYDYQVSMEPIPEEIAALGGPCQGTIHAYPSRIAMALTELQMEEDPVLKAEVEKRIPEIEAALEEEIGGDFVVDGVILQDDLSWVFICTEVATGYQFDLCYANFEYEAQINNTTSPQNAISVEYYYREIESIAIRENLYPIIGEIFNEGDYIVRAQVGGGIVDIVIGQYTDKEIEQCMEQEKILKLWEALQKYDNTKYYNLSLVFFPLKYENVIKEKYRTTIRYDFGNFISDKYLSYLAERKEIWGGITYSEIDYHDDYSNLNTFLQKYNVGEYEEDIIWDFWIY